MTRRPVRLAGGDAPASLAELAYERIKQDIFQFRLVPGARFSENELAARLGMSRTPVRDALYRLQREGYVDVHFRNGWSVKAIDLDQFEHLYDLRMVLEATAVRRLCENMLGNHEQQRLQALRAVWLGPPQDRQRDQTSVADMDEDFHITLVAAAGNPEIGRVHREVTERICIIRRLDFTKAARIEETYNEHGQILSAVLARRADQAVMLLCSHIETSRAEVRKITLHRLYEASKGSAA